MLKKHLTSKIFLFLVTATAIFISVSGFLTSGGENLLFQLLFLPITAYLIYASFQAIKHTNLEVILSQKRGGLFFYLLLFFALAIIAVSHLAQSEEKEPPLSEEKTMTLSPSLTPTPTPQAEKRVIIKTENANEEVNVREAPSTASKIIGQVSRGEEFILIEKKGDWYQVKFEDGFGYLYKEYVTVSKD
jgi:uncharacterized protein YgiM (DUF1202 family)